MAHLYRHQGTGETTMDYGKAMEWADRGATVTIYKKTGSTVHPAGTGDRRGQDPLTSGRLEDLI